MMTPRKFKLFLITKLPIAYIAGVKLFFLSSEKCVTQISLSWFSQNPFKSMFWAVQGMAAELSTGLLCITEIKNSNQNISMLVVKQEATFSKKAVGKISFTCEEGNLVRQTIQKALQTKQGETVTLSSKGIDEQNNIVSEFLFVWSFKVRK